MIEIGGEPRLKNGESPVNQPLDETLLPRNNRQLSSRPVFIINDGLSRFQGKFVIFRKVFVECGCDRPRAVPSSPIVRSLEAKEIEERRGGGEKARDREKARFYGKNPINPLPFELAFHRLIPFPRFPLERINPSPRRKIVGRINPTSGGFSVVLIHPISRTRGNRVSKNFRP